MNIILKILYRMLYYNFQDYATMQQEQQIIIT